jgi:hypothetical protein
MYVDSFFLLTFGYIFVHSCICIRPVQILIYALAHIRALIIFSELF